ncbi:MAG TPA: PAS domain S-box protein [Mycobacterium sp.]|nr:PAS domain S-box protein [Mycobacterium sp.]
MAELREDDIAAAILRGPDAIIAADAEGVIRFWNPGAERIFGFGSDEAVGQSLDLIIPERLRARHWAGWWKVMETGRSRYGETDLLKVPSLRKDGSKISVEFTISLMLGPDGKIFGMAATLRDVTRAFNEIKELHKKLAAQSRPQGQPGDVA